MASITAVTPPRNIPTSIANYRQTDENGNQWAWDLGLKKWILVQPTTSSSQTNQPTIDAPIIEGEIPEYEDNIPSPPPQEEWSGRVLLQGKSSTIDPKLKKKRKQEARQNPHVYVTGLPLDITKEEIAEYFAKAGVIKKDPDTGRYQVKLYLDNETQKPKGDALVSYFKPESVPLALKFLDESYIRPGCMIRVSQASFDATQTKKKKKKKKKKDNKRKAVDSVEHNEEEKEAGGEEDEDEKFNHVNIKKKKKKLRVDQMKELSWDEDDRRHVVLKHLFAPSELPGPEEIEELRNEIGTECEKVGGPVEKIIIFENNPEGVVVVKFIDHWPAVRCIEKMNGRWFAGRQLTADFYDGITNYKVEETEEQRLQRERQWLSFIESSNNSSGNSNSSTSSSVAT